MKRHKSNFRRIVSAFLAAIIVTGTLSGYTPEAAYADEPAGIVREILHIGTERTSIEAGEGRFSHRFSFSVEKKSEEPYEDIIRFRLISLSSTGKGRELSGKENVTFEQDGNDLVVITDDLLDFEKYTIVIGYEQTYFWNGYSTIISRTEKGKLTDTYDTPQDRYVRDGTELAEKVHKYGSLALAGDISCGGKQCVVDKSRHGWQSDGNTSTVSIDGNGCHVRREGDGAAFIVKDGCELTLKDIYIDAYSGYIESTPTDGGEYITQNATGGAHGVGILVGTDMESDGLDRTDGKLILTGSEVYGGRSAVVFRYGSMDIRRSLLYGMGEKNVFEMPSGDGYFGSGLGIINSSNETIESDNRVNISQDCRIYGRFNGVFIQGNSSLDISDSFIRGDCEDAFDFRGTGSLGISRCRINGVKGIDNYHDATLQAVMSSLDISTGIFDGNEFRKKVHGDKNSYRTSETGILKGTVTVEDTDMYLLTGPFRGNSSAAGAGIQNHGNMTVGKGVSIDVRHSGAWDYLPSGSRAASVGIWNSKALELPEDIRIDTDDVGIRSTRDIESLETALRLFSSLEQEKIYEAQEKVTANEGVFEYLDDGLKSVLTLTGGNIRGRDTGVSCNYGSMIIDAKSSLTIEGRNTGISVGINGYDRIYGNDAMNVSFEITGDKETRVLSSLHGKGLLLKKTAHGSLFAPLVISGISDRCGEGIVNHGVALIKYAQINAEESGIRNAPGGVMYLGNDLDDEPGSVVIKEAVTGLDNSGTVIYYRDVEITGSKKAAVYQDGIFYMLAGSEVSTDTEGHNVIHLAPERTVRLYYDQYEESLVSSTIGTLYLSPEDRNPGRVMVEIYSPWGSEEGTDYSQESYEGLSDDEKHRITDMMTGFDLAFDKVMDHEAALRSGLGRYGEEDTNGRAGTLVLSCRLSASYLADFPVKNDHITSEDPEKTWYYWREPTEFTVASELYETDRSRILYDGRDISQGLYQTGWHDRNKDGSYGTEVYSEERVTRIYGDDHVFCGIWDTRFTMLFDGNGQTNRTENYTESNVTMEYVFPGNTGPERKSADYFGKSIIKDGLYHPVAYDGWSLSDSAMYRDEGIFRKDDSIEDSLRFYIDAVIHGNVTFDDDKAIVRIYAVWDVYPQITAFDSYFYAYELSDADEIRRRLLAENVVSARDICDGEIGNESISVYTDPKAEEFSTETMKNLGDLGTVNVYYSASDNNGHTSMKKSRVHIMTEDSEDTSDDISHGSGRGASGSSNDTMLSAPVYVRNIDSRNKKSLSRYSVWREEAYNKALDHALSEDRVLEKWHFTDDDIKETKKLLYDSDAGTAGWRQKFLVNRIDVEDIERGEKGKKLIVEEGLSSMRIIWDLKSETDRIELTITGHDGSVIPADTIQRDKPEKMKSVVVIDTLKPGMTYDVTADFYYKDHHADHQYRTIKAASLEKPVCQMSTEDSGNDLKVKLTWRSDRNAGSYIVQRKRLKPDENGWDEVKTVLAIGDELMEYDEIISDEGIYRYRIKSEGAVIGGSRTEESEYSDEVETAFLYRPVIKETTSGCRSIQIVLEKKTAADYIRIFYRTQNGILMHTDYNADGKPFIISDSRLSDGKKYEISAVSYISSDLSGKTYSSKVSENVSETTYDLKAPVIKNAGHKDIYSSDGNHIIYQTDDRAEEYRIRIRNVYPTSGKTESVIASPDGEYLHTPERSGVYTYIVMAYFRTLDGKRFSISSEKVRAAYIRPQSTISEIISDGGSAVIDLNEDTEADGYLIKVMRENGTSRKIYVPKGADSVEVTASGEDLTVMERRTVIFCNGVEYTGECV